MKQVFTGREVPHIFAAQSQPRGRNSNDSLWFEGATLYSYRQPIARFYGDACLVSADSFSVTTSKHQSWARYALNHIETHSVYGLKALCEILNYKSEGEALRYIKARMADIAALESSLSRMRADWKISQCRAEIATHERGCEIAWRAIGKRGDWRKTAGKTLAAKERAERKARYDRAFGALQHAVAQELPELPEKVARIIAEGDTFHKGAMRRLETLESDWRRRDTIGAYRVPETATMTDARKVMGKAWYETYRALALQLDAAIIEHVTPVVEREREKHAAFERLENAEKLAKWLACENVPAPRMSEVECRVIGETVETSHGARVPLADALRVVKLAKACRDKGETFRKDTFATGPYKGVTVDAQGNVTIGCHHLTWRAISECVARFKPEVLA